PRGNRSVEHGADQFGHFLCPEILASAYPLDRPFKIRHPVPTLAACPVDMGPLDAAPSNQEPLASMKLTRRPVRPTASHRPPSVFQPSAARRPPTVPESRGKIRTLAAWRLRVEKPPPPSPIHATEP